MACTTLRRGHDWTRFHIYDYPAQGTKTLWPGLDAFQSTKLDPDTIDIAELKQRFLVTQAVEAARVIEDGVVTDPREADVGSIIGFGFAPFTGGTLSYISMEWAPPISSRFASGCGKNMGTASRRPTFSWRWRKRARAFMGASPRGRNASHDLARVAGPSGFANQSDQIVSRETFWSGSPVVPVKRVHIIRKRFSLLRQPVRRAATTNRAYSSSQGARHDTWSEC